MSVGGLKLEKAIREFSLDFTGKIVLDIGASTGGFTDCALRHGAALVYAIDVGQNQLADSLRNHSNVISFEKMNYKDFYLDEKVDIVVMDISFTSQKPVFSHISRWLKPGGWLISLIKPQFEMSQRMHFEHGIIKNEEIHQMVINSVIEHAAKHQLELQKVTSAPEGVNKNKEFLAWFVFNSS
ncbi:MAG: SAM-dependent methyltransferase [Chitinophagales bacterium]|nr:SAM-dependent methyltransferase [Chitinophagales bacterium]